MGKRTSQLTQLTAAQVAQGDFLPIVDVSAGQTKYVTVKDLTGLPDFGWTATGESWAYSSFNTTTRVGVITVPTDATTKYNAEMWVRLTQTTGGTKWGKILSVTATTLTVYFGSSYTLNNEAITSPVYSPLAVPVGLVVGNFEVAFAASKTTGSGSQSIPGGFSDQVVDFNNVLYQYGGGFDTSTDRFTAPVKGLYQFNCMVHFAGGPTRGIAHWRINGTSVSRFGEISVGAGTEISFDGAIQVLLSAGDYVDFVVSGSVASTLYTSTGTAGKGGGDPAFNGRLIQIMP